MNMSDDSIINEFRTLLADTREHLLYLQELGVENLRVELPSEINLNEIKSAKIEKFVPDFALKETVAEKPVITTNSTLQKNMLAATKLSNFTTTSSEKETQIFQPFNHKSEMPKPKLINLEPTLELNDSNETLADIRAEIGDCKRCKLCEERTNIVHSEGNPQARLMFVGEAPGADEDEQSRPFVGRAGQLLTKIIEAIGIKREEVFIGNINRCRPPQNRAPLPDETAACKPYLLREIAVLKPQVVVVLGNTAMKNLLGTKEGITKLRGNFQDYHGVKVMPTFHPAYLLRDPHKKREVWEDMKKIRDYLAENSR